MIAHNKTSECADELMSKFCEVDDSFTLSKQDLDKYVAIILKYKRMEEALKRVCLVVIGVVALLTLLGFFHIF